MANDLTIAITSVPLAYRSRLKAEICEHKGIGHPDSICDGIAEAASQALCRAYLEHTGAIQHCNVDKALLIGGEARPRFGGGQILQPIRLILCGRATPLRAPRTVQEIIGTAVQEYLADHLRVPTDLFQIEVVVRNGSANLQQVFSSARAVARANDTSFGVGYAPLSRLEKAVLQIAELLKSPAFRGLFPAAGDDFKIMGRRIDTDMAFTIALAFIDRHIPRAADYQAIKQQVQEHIVDSMGVGHDIRINTLDADVVQSENDAFLTVTGLSAEHGDDGQVGRGNRINGLITPNRTMSLEAAAGKNPVAHVGKLYNVLAQQIAQELVAQLDDVDEVSVQLLSAIGMPVDQPQLVNIEIVQDGTLSVAAKTLIKRIITERLSQTHALSMQLVEGKISMF